MQQTALVPLLKLSLLMWLSLKYILNKERRLRNFQVGKEPIIILLIMQTRSIFVQSFNFFWLSDYAKIAYLIRIRLL